MIDASTQVTEKLLRDARTGAYYCPRPRPTRVFYIGVGNLPPSRAQQLANMMIEEFKRSIDDFNYENFFLIVHDQESRIEVLPPYSAPPPPITSVPPRTVGKWRKFFSWIGDR